MSYPHAALAICLLLLATGCSSVTMEQRLPDQSLQAPAETGMSRVVFYNDTKTGLFPASKRVGIKVDGKGLGTLYAGQYVRVDLAPGRHHLDLSHRDTVEFHDEYSLRVEEADLYVRVFCTELTTTFEAS